MRNGLWIILLVLSLSAYALCMAFDAFLIDGPEPSAWSSPFMLLLFGWMGIFGGAVAWFANPLLLASWILLVCGLSRVALWIAGGALLTGLSFLTIDSLLISEAPTFAHITRLGAGYWLWLVSMGLAMVAGLARATAQASRFRSEKTSL